MNKYYLPGVLVVEGKSDVSYLSSFISTLYFITNGYDINEEKLDFLNRVFKLNSIYILTDNDEAGKNIEEKIKNKINGVFTLKTPKIPRKNSKKLGVAETDKDAVVETLKPYLEVDKGQLVKTDYQLANVISLSNKPQETRNKIINDYRLIEGNNKFLENQLQMLKVDPQDLRQKYGN